MTELFIKAGLVAAIVGALLLPTSISANGAQMTRNGLALLVPKLSPSTTLPLPSIAHLDAIPWLVLHGSQKKLKIDTLLPLGGPRSDFAHSRNSAPLWLSSGMTSTTASEDSNG